MSEFKEYISETQKMRAYKGEISGPLAAQGAGPGAVTQRDHTLPGDMAADLFSNTATLEQMRELQATQTGAAGPANNIVPITIIALLAVLAVGLAIALILR